MLLGIIRGLYSRVLAAQGADGTGDTGSRDCRRRDIAEGHACGSWLAARRIHDPWQWDLGC